MSFLGNSGSFVGPVPLPYSIWVLRGYGSWDLTHFWPNLGNNHSTSSSWQKTWVPGARPRPMCVRAFLKMTHGYWEKEGSFSSGVAKLLVAIYCLGCMEKGYVQQQKKQKQNKQTKMRPRYSGNRAKIWGGRLRVTWRMIDYLNPAMPEARPPWLPFHLYAPITCPLLLKQVWITFCNLISRYLTQLLTVLLAISSSFPCLIHSA